MIAPLVFGAQRFGSTEGMAIGKSDMQDGVAGGLGWASGELPLLSTESRRRLQAGGAPIELIKLYNQLLTTGLAVLGVFADLPTALDTLDRNAAPIWLVAQEIRDPGNLGTMLRTGDAVGAGGLILLDDCTDPFSVESVRASMGALFTQHIARANGADFLAWLRAGPGQLVGTSLQTETDYQTPDYAPPVFILTGNEARGLPDDYETACDLLVRMPMMGKADSLNAAVATAVMAYEVLNQLRRS